MKKILLIDDSNVLTNILTDIFSKNSNFMVFKAKTFKEAKELISINSFFASISNITLSDTSSKELTDYLNFKEIPTIILSSKDNEDFQEITKNKNIIDYISKNSMYELNSVFRLINLLTYTEDLEVLIVDDSSVIISQLKDILESLLFKVHVAKDGKEAINIFKKNNHISMIITDYHMKGSDGLEVIMTVRKSEDNHNLPIIIMTNDNSNELKIKFYKNGATDFLQKPILKEELKSKVLNIFSNMKRIKEIRKFNKVIDENVITSSTDSRGIITSVSKAFCEISGYSKNELLGNTHGLVRHPDMPETLYRELWQTITSGKQWKGEIKNKRKDGNYYWVKVIIEPQFDKKGIIIGFSSVRQDITDRKRIYELSITDALTTLYNRRYFNEIAQSLIENAVRNNNTFGFLILDIDNFKKYNDTYGHQKGDDVLISVANSLKETFRRSDDKIFRLGGEEFGVLINAKTKSDVLSLVENARENILALEIPHQKNKPLKILTASFGLVILVSKTSMLLDYIYKIGDDKLYEAKANGRNRIESFEI